MERMHGTIRIGTAGWSIPKQHAAAFPDDGTHLERYARRFPAIEINSSFYRPHQPRTYARWAGCVPAGFRFAVKMPREITHVRHLTRPAEPLDRFLAEIRALDDRLGPLLVQLPPSLRYEDGLVDAFLAALRARFDGDVVCEPRHPSWFTDAVDGTLSRFRIARVAADPAPVLRAFVPGGWAGIVYRRLHGSPEMYVSAYSAAALDATARAVSEAAARGVESWCIFDNTARGAATEDALGLMARL
jgi:uncharacterized protein YecE (DUF72 family)